MKPEFQSINQPFSNEITINEKSYLYFGGTAYLGIPQHQEFQDLYVEGIKKFGLNNGTSRSNNIQLGIYNEAEKVAAARYHAEDALITSSGYLAAQLTVKHFAAFGAIAYAPNTHTALWLNDPPPVSGTFTSWKNDIVDQINTSTEKNWVLISNSMNNLQPEIYDFGFLNAIEPDKNIVLIVDDSHGIGINNQGLSVLNALPKNKNVSCIVIASMAKALGVDAGLVLGSKKIISALKNSNMFVGASPPAAAGLHAFIRAEGIYQDQWSKLQKNMALLHKSLGNKWKFAPGFPAFLIDDSTIDQYLLEENILISSFPYPTKDSDPINRIVLSSWHEEKDIISLVKTLSKR
ncbi:aminotransferase class I/II-fold pyridoxal phosphate-dependent enzyme [Pedobacter petrophilus]|uniref:Aminotransferase class I/II-fold pyridoxal phosphate-dependent enzyme n=1 Tax=Pedobacter petrophilus TaxID=1908241 RepID=A0A7K0G2E2_9SPHI|nr:aminotransferase class I/II-fold pyridoxal phosphate-dependent enzyme [Pedobacter petrophilus]MRX77439.1 aminotransferase class I/II-fold pyridoxal phosphate-dependent enzyme [Pedobacter petrophilus]